jgi:hypothetical protein
VPHSDGRNDSDESIREVLLQLDGDGSVTRAGDTGTSWDWTDADGNTDRGPANVPADGHADGHADGNTRGPANVLADGHADGHADGNTDHAPADVRADTLADGHTDRHSHTVPVDPDAVGLTDTSTDLRRYVGRDPDRHDWKGPEPDQ